ncbi:MAG: type II toxin-antitoxin system RelE/ParE family toxin [Pseudonocardiaceae bacterium]
MPPRRWRPCIPIATLADVVHAEWQVYVVNEVRDWLDTLDSAAHSRVVQAIDTLADSGPGLGRPLVDTIHGSSIANLKELRPRQRADPVRVRSVAIPPSCSSPVTRPAGGMPGTRTRSRWPSSATSAISRDEPTTRRNSDEQPRGLERHPGRTRRARRWRGRRGGGQAPDARRGHRTPPC